MSVCVCVCVWASCRIAVKVRHPVTCVLLTRDPLPQRNKLPDWWVVFELLCVRKCENTSDLTVVSSIYKTALTQQQSYTITICNAVWIADITTMRDSPLGILCQEYKMCHTREASISLINI